MIGDSYASIRAHLLICSTQPRGAVSAQQRALWRDEDAAENVKRGEVVKESVSNSMSSLSMCMQPYKAQCSHLCISNLHLPV